MTKKRTSFALSVAVLQKLKELAEKHNRSQASMVEVLVLAAK